MFVVDVRPTHVSLQPHVVSLTVAVALTMVVQRSHHRAVHLGSQLTVAFIGRMSVDSSTAVGDHLV